MRVFGPGPTRIGVSSAHSTDAVMTRARISMLTPRHRLRGAGDHGVDEPVRGTGPGQRLDDARAPLDRDVVHDQQEHAPGLQVRPVGHGAGLAGPGRRRRGVHPPAPARHRVLVVLGEDRGDRRGVHELVRRDHPEVVRVRQVPPARAGALAGTAASSCPGSRSRPGARRERRAACPASLPAAAPRLRCRRVFCRAGHRPTAASRSSPSSATPPAPASPAAPTGPRPAPSAPRSASPGPRSACPEAQPPRRGHHQARTRTRQPSSPQTAPAAARKPRYRSENVTPYQHKPTVA